LLCSAAALYLQGCANNLFLFSASRALLYISAGGLPPILQKQLSAMTPKRKRGSVFGFSSAFNSSGGMIAALIGGWCFSHISLNGVFYVAASVFALSVFIFYNGLKKALLLSKRTAGVK
jgi:MFS family permease